MFGGCPSVEKEAPSEQKTQMRVFEIVFGVIVVTCNVALSLLQVTSEWSVQ